MAFLTIKDMQQIASDHGGKCLSKEYINNTSLMKWMCENGHTWDMTYGIVKQGGWCQQCIKSSRKNDLFLEYKQLAKNNGCQLISKEYIDHRSKLKWLCNKGHEWMAPPSMINAGYWCNQCVINKLNEKRLVEIKLIAQKYGGVCFSKYYNGEEKLDFECSNGHKFSREPSAIRKKQWCVVCTQEKLFNIRFKELQAIAKKRKGVLLSPSYKGANRSHWWQCDKGHKWKACPSNIKQGSWCPICIKEIVDINQRKYTIKDLQKHAAKYGGLVLSEKYERISTSLKWQCAEGHIWQANSYSIMSKGSWCKTCGSRRKEAKLKKYKVLAEKHHVKLISETYTDRLSPLKFRCTKGHIWEATPISIQNKLLCRVCHPGIERDKNYLEKYQQLAIDKKGKLLSKLYVNANTKLKWQCENGHEWMARPEGIKAGWCRKCFYNRRRAPIEDFKAIAKKHGGKLLSKEYISSAIPLKFECKEGHIWSASAGNLKSGTWCRICRRKEGAEKSKHTIEKLKEYAAQHGGNVLTKKYKTSRDPVKWQCKEGHVWLAMPGSVLNATSWCNVCNIKNRKTPIGILQKMAKDNDGKLLSLNYINNTAPLEWQCKNGHVWLMSPKVMKRNDSWCQECTKEQKQIIAYKEYQALAKQKKGKLISETYINSYTHLTWQCHKNHIWQAIPSEVKRRSWCPKCALERRNKNK